MTPGVSATLQCGPTPHQLAARDPGKIEIDGEPVAVRSHALGMPIFVCRCGRDAYRLYECGGMWLCRRCGQLDYSSRHKHRTVPGLNRIAWLRRRLRLDPRPFSPIPPRPLHYRRYWRIARQIRRIEAELLQHAETIANVIERRYERRHQN